MIQYIDKRLLADLTRHSRMLGLKRLFLGMGYERNAELPLIASRLEPLFGESLRYLDIGSGNSVLPSYLLSRTKWDITCIDKFSSVQKQLSNAYRILGSSEIQHRFHIRQENFLSSNLPEDWFDIITSISVIEHFEELYDSVAMEKIGKLLRKGGICLLTTLVNEGHFKEFFLKDDVYGKRYDGKVIFFQRHYDLKSLDLRIVRPSKLKEKERIYFGEYDFQFGEKFIVLDWPWKFLKIFYQWASSIFAQYFISYRDYPISRNGMHMYTTSGVFLSLKKQ